MAVILAFNNMQIYTYMCTILFIDCNVFSKFVYINIKFNKYEYYNNSNYLKEEIGIEKELISF